MTITKEMLKQLRTDMDKALSDVAKKHNLIISTGNMSFSAEEVNIKVKAMVKSEGVENKADAMNAKYAKDFEQYAELFGLKDVALGSKFRSGSKVFTIVGLDSKKRKNPFIIQDQNGSQYVAKSDMIKGALAVNKL